MLSFCFCFLANPRTSIPMVNNKSFGLEFLGGFLDAPLLQHRWLDRA